MSAHVALLDKFISEVKSLPPAPRTLPILLSLLARDDVNASSVVDAITFDSALTAAILQQANSALSAAAQTIEDLPTAIHRLGFNRVYRIVADVVGARTLGGAQAGYGIARGELWLHSAATALAAQAIARNLNANENVAFTAGLLHDLGKLVISTALDRQYDAIVQQTEQGGRSFQEAEKAILGVDHAEIGGRLLERWNFPPHLIQAVRHHHDPINAGPTNVPLAATVSLANTLAHLLGHGYGHHAYALRAHGEALAVLELTPKEVDRLMIAAQDAIKASRLLPES